MRPIKEFRELERKEMTKEERAFMMRWNYGEQLYYEREWSKICIKLNPNRSAEYGR